MHYVNSLSGHPFPHNSSVNLQRFVGDWFAILNEIVSQAGLIEETVEQTVERGAGESQQPRVCV